MVALINTLIALTFDEKKNQPLAEKFLKEKSTTLAFFFYDLIIVYANNNDVYLSAYDFVQPDSTMINSPEAMNPVYISDNYKDALEKDLQKFKKIKDDYKVTGTSTIYHKAYQNYVDKNIKILCKFFYSQDSC